MIMMMMMIIIIIIIISVLQYLIFGKGGEHERAHWQPSGIHPISRQKLVPSIQICHSVFILPGEERFMMRTAFCWNSNARVPFGLHDDVGKHIFPQVRRTADDYWFVFGSHSDLAAGIRRRKDTKKQLNHNKNFHRHWIRGVDNLK